MSSSTDSGHWSEYESKAGSEIGCKAASNTQEPGYALTEREVNNKVVELMAEVSRVCKSPCIWVELSTALGL